MLAQNFKTAADLGISEVEVDALIKVLGMLERGDIDAKHFIMDMYLNDCETFGCIAGWAHLVSNKRAFPEVDDRHGGSMCIGKPDALRELFRNKPEHWGRNRSISPAQAAHALRSYLTTGDANWADALAQ